MKGRPLKGRYSYQLVDIEARYAMLKLDRPISSCRLRVAFFVFKMRKLYDHCIPDCLQNVSSVFKNTPSAKQFMLEFRVGIPEAFGVLE